MIQTELKPVTVYRNTDTGAPQLTGTAGSLKTVLKACLVEGYGSQSSLGWEMPFENNTDAVFRSKDPKSCRIALGVKNTGQRVAELSIMDGPSGLDAARAVSRINGARFPYMPSSGTSNSWVLIGHSRAFVLLIKGLYRSRIVWFGDFPSFAPADTGNCLLYYHYQSSDAVYMYTDGIRVPRVLSPSYNDSHCVGQIARAFNGLTTGALTSFSSLAACQHGVAYPDVISNGLDISETYINELINSRWPLRGIWPGMYWCRQNLSSIPDWTRFEGFAGSGDRFLNCCLNDADSNPEGWHLLVNISNWVA
nr:MAG TPA: hypothetical protein [Caudoviricetes sp.]